VKSNAIALPRSEAYDIKRTARDFLDAAGRNRRLGPPCSRGILLCRLNSKKDVHFGARGYPRIAENYYSVDGEPKRFFDKASIQELFNKGWRTVAAEEMMIDKV
jgi:hypothetical protein